MRTADPDTVVSGPDLDIVIVDYNAGRLVRDCLESLTAHEPHDVRIGRTIVVDNASREPTSDFLDSLGRDVTVVRNETNRGFAAACNQGARLGTARYVLFLNPDTRLLPGSLDVPVAYLDAAEHADVGIVGIQLLDDDGRVTTSCFDFPRVRHFLYRAMALDRLLPDVFPSGTIPAAEHSATRAVDQVMGAFFLVRRSLFDRLGGFDERFFVYFEEVDFALRARQSGSASVFLVSAAATHVGCGTTASIKGVRLRLSVESRLRYGRKHFGPLRQAVLFVTSLVVEPLSRTVLAAAIDGVGGVREVWSAYAELWRRLPDIVRRPA